jgi:glycosyltransferase involved in cell wall biosynthesis
MNKKRMIQNNTIHREIHTLHVTDCFNAGVGKLIMEIISNSKEKTSLLWDAHSDSPNFIFENKDKGFLAIQWNGGLFQRIKHLRKIVADLNPNVVHAHSSMAGFYVRLFIHKRRKLYSPHCFSFDRLDIGLIKRCLYYVAEQILHLFTSAYVANWPIEVTEISRFRPRKDIYFMRPSASYLSSKIIKESNKNLRIPKFIAVGRIRPQKGPDFFAEVAKKVKEKHIADFIWIGEGDLDLKAILLDAGVTVIPWTSPMDIGSFYLESTATLITSKWESGPLTLFESLNCSTPTIIRKSKYAEAYGLQSYESLEEMATKCIEMMNDQENYNLLNLQINQCEEIFADLQRSRVIKPY